MRLSKQHKIDEFGVPRGGLLDPFLRFISVCLFLFLVFVVVSVRVSDSVHDLLVLCAFCSQTTPPLPKKIYI